MTLAGHRAYKKVIKGPCDPCNYALLVAKVDTFSDILVLFSLFFVPHIGFSKVE